MIENLRFLGTRETKIPSVQKKDRLITLSGSTFMFTKYGRKKTSFFQKKSNGMKFCSAMVHLSIPIFSF